MTNQPRQPHHPRQPKHPRHLHPDLFERHRRAVEFPGDPRQQISRQELLDCGGSATALPRRIKKLRRKSAADVVKTISSIVSMYPAASTSAAETRRIP
jgi:hypothetical protein